MPSDHARQPLPASQRNRWVGPLSALVLLLPLAGCGVSAYETKMAETVDRLERLERFSALYEVDSQVPGTGVTLRIPQGFTTAYNESSADPVSNQGTIDPNRVQPPFIKLPGFRVAYERFEHGSEGGLPLYLYVAVNEPGDEAVAETIVAELTAAFPGQEIAWTPVMVDTPDASAPQVEWQRLEVQGKQMFFMAGGRQEEKEGIFTLWRRIDSETKTQVLLGWRQAVSTLGNRDLRRVADVVAGTVKIAQPTEQPAQQPAQ